MFSQANSSYQSYALISLTQPIVDNTDPAVVLGYMTVVAAASSLIDVTQSREGLGDTGMVLLVGPNRRVSKNGEGHEEIAIKRSPLGGVGSRTDANRAT